jgi:hypothetical protein
LPIHTVISVRPFEKSYCAKYSVMEFPELFQ